MTPSVNPFNRTGRMLLALTCAVQLAGALIAQVPPNPAVPPGPHVPMPPPGNPNHEQPTEGNACRAPGATPDPFHDCACEPRCMDGTDEFGQPDGTMYRTEDTSKCRAACHPKFCLCPNPCA